MIVVYQEIEKRKSILIIYQLLDIHCISYFHFLHLLDRKGESQFPR